MSPRLSICSLIGLAGWFVSGAPVSGEETFEHVLAPVFREHCVACHGENGKAKGDVDLLDVTSPDRLLADPDLIGVLLDVLDFQEMPPEDEPELPDEKRVAAIAALESLLDRSLAGESTFAPTPARRMNRFQYNNAVQDLFDLTVEVFSLPERMCREHGDYFQPETGKMPDVVKVGSRPLGKSQLIERRLGGVAAFPQDLRAEHGYDNRGDHLTLSPLLMESFLRLGKSIVESHDFNEKTCGTWEDWFADPSPESDLESAVRERLADFLGRAFRRPADEETIERYASHALARLDAGTSFADAMKETAAAALASPRFLYLYDGATEGEGTLPVDDFELASRLSFFLWGSIPDRKLNQLAGMGDLRRPEVLAAEVDRMLRDDKLKRFCDSFPSQWMQLERIVTSAPDPDKYSDFYFAKYRTSMHMMLEPLLLFETVLVENRSVVELIDSDFSYRSRRLRRWYGEDVGKDLGGPTVLEFERVPIADRRHGGIITTAALMTMTSGPDRTHPITRGAWIATAIFNNPPEPPPADVPPLEESGKDVENLTLRERFAAHREQAACAGCHERIDPLGFALENFGPAGEWREEYENGRAVDAAGTLFREHEFTDVVGFKDAILAEKERFVRAFAAHLLSFSLGREITAADSPSLDRIAAEASAHDYRFHSLIRGIVTSDSFLQKYIPPKDLARN